MSRTIVPTWRPAPEIDRFYRAAGMWHPASVTDDLRRCVDRFGDKVAVRDSTTQLTFGQLWDRAAALAGWLRERGLRRGDAVAVQLPSWTEAVVAFHGVLMAGGVVVPMTSILRQREVGFVVRQTGARFAIVAEEFRGYSYRDLYADLIGEGIALDHVLWVRGGAGGERFEEALRTEPVDVETALASAGRDGTATSRSSSTPRGPPPTPRARSTRTRGSRPRATSVGARSGLTRTTCSSTRRRSATSPASR